MKKGIIWVVSSPARRAGERIVNVRKIGDPLGKIKRHIFEMTSMYPNSGKQLILFWEKI